MQGFRDFWRVFSAEFETPMAMFRWISFKFLPLAFGGWLIFCTFLALEPFR